MEKKNTTEKIKLTITDLLADCLGSFLIAIGVYNFAAASEFPVTGVSGLALVFYYYWKLPIGIMTMCMNIPIILICGRILGIKFMLKSLKTMLISTFFMDVVAPLFPIYRGELMLSCICMGLFAGIGYALIYMRNTSTGGTDFITMTIRALNPHLSLGKIIVVMDCSVLLLCGLLMGGNVDKIIYGLIGTYIMSIVVDKVMYGLDAGKLTLSLITFKTTEAVLYGIIALFISTYSIDWLMKTLNISKLAFVITDKGVDISGYLISTSPRGVTLVNGTGAYTQKDRQILICALKDSEIPEFQRKILSLDENAFIIYSESQQIVGKGFYIYG